jgi:hypothetical protein
MRDPVIVPESGWSYERSNIEARLRESMCVRSSRELKMLPPFAISTAIPNMAGLGSRERVQPHDHARSARSAQARTRASACSSSPARSHALILAHRRSQDHMLISTNAPSRLPTSPHFFSLFFLLPARLLRSKSPSSPSACLTPFPNPLPTVHSPGPPSPGQPPFPSTAGGGMGADRCAAPPRRAAPRRARRTDPVTGAPLTSRSVLPNVTLRLAILRHAQVHPSGCPTTTTTTTILPPAGLAPR